MNELTHNGRPVRILPANRKYPFHRIDVGGHFVVPAPLDDVEKVLNRVRVARCSWQQKSGQVWRIARIFAGDQTTGLHVERTA